VINLVILNFEVDTAEGDIRHLILTADSDIRLFLFQIHDDLLSSVID